MNGMYIVTTDSGTCRARGVMGDNAPAFGGKAPEADPDFPEGVDVRQGFFGRCFGENGNGLVREKPVSPGLAHGFAPIGQFTLERSGAGFCFFDKFGKVGIGSTVCVLPRDDKQVGYAVTVDGYFSSEGELVADGTVMNALRLLKICPHKGNGETVLGGGFAFASRQIVPGLAEFQFRYGCQCSAHVGTVMLSALKRQVNSANSP